MKDSVEIINNGYNQLTCFVQILLQNLDEFAVVDQQGALLGYLEKLDLESHQVVEHI